MVAQIVEVVIELAAILAGVGGVVFLAYFIGVLWWERRERLAFIEDHVREQEIRRATRTPDFPHPILGAPAPVTTRSHSLTEHSSLR